MIDEFAALFADPLAYRERMVAEHHDLIVRQRAEDDADLAHRVRVHDALDRARRRRHLTTLPAWDARDVLGSLPDDALDRWATATVAGHHDPADYLTGWRCGCLDCITPEGVSEPNQWGRKPDSSGNILDFLTYAQRPQRRTHRTAIAIPMPDPSTMRKGRYGPRLHSALVSLTHRALSDMHEAGLDLPARKELARGLFNFLGSLGIVVSEHDHQMNGGGPLLGRTTRKAWGQAKEVARFALDTHDYDAHRGASIERGRKGGSGRPPIATMADLDPYVGQTVAQQMAALRVSESTVQRLRRARRAADLPV